MFAKSRFLHRLLAACLAYCAWQPLQAASIDAIADRATEAQPSARPQGTETRQLRPAVEVAAIYGLGEALRTDLILDGKVLTGKIAGSDLPNGMRVAKILPMEVILSSGKKTIRLHFSASPQVSESEERRGPGVDNRSPSLKMPAGAPPAEGRF